MIDSIIIRAFFSIPISVFFIFCIKNVNIKVILAITIIDNISKYDTILSIMLFFASIPIMMVIILLFIPIAIVIAMIITILL